MASVVASLPLYHVGDASISLQFVEELFQHLTSHFSQLVTIEDFMHWFNESSPMEVCCAVLVFITFSCWFVALVTQNHSQVDRIWSIIPWVYVWQFQQRNTRDVRLLLMALLTTTWGLRLTFNFGRPLQVLLVPDTFTHLLIAERNISQRSPGSNNLRLHGLSPMP